MNKQDKRRVTEVLDMANKMPYHAYEVVVKGFKFLIHWDKKRQWFEGVMSCSPSSASTHYLYDDAIESFVQKVELEINEAMKCYKSGGKY